MWFSDRASERVATVGGGDLGSPGYGLIDHGYLAPLRPGEPLDPERGLSILAGDLTLEEVAFGSFRVVFPHLGRLRVSDIGWEG